jgi:hypothetical protein
MSLRSEFEAEIKQAEQHLHKLRSAFEEVFGKAENEVITTERVIEMFTLRDTEDGLTTTDIVGALGMSRSANTAAYGRTYEIITKLERKRQIVQVNKPAKSHKRFRLKTNVETAERPSEARESQAKGATPVKPSKPARARRRQAKHKPGETRKLADEFAATHERFTANEFTQSIWGKPASDVGHANAILKAMIKEGKVRQDGWAPIPGSNGKNLRGRQMKYVSLVYKPPRETVVRPGEGVAQGRRFPHYGPRA